jgi:5,10-methylene-tetrahydrofolate dehydrogenase/methenyl tetrahydrofolate cyclohydrolase
MKRSIDPNDLAGKTAVVIGQSSVIGPALRLLKSLSTNA